MHPQAEKAPNANSDDSLRVLHLGSAPYDRVLELQRQLQRELIEGFGRDILLTCEHSPAITLGTAAKRENLLVPESKLSELGISLFETERGGDITYHGPGQIVAYPIIDLKRRKRDVDWYMRSLEEVTIRVLARYGVEGSRDPGKTGVWIGAQGPEGLEKIASIGVRISRWCTMHGLALNVRNCSDGFALMHPCGLPGIRVTSLEQCGVSAEVTEVGAVLVREFKDVFGYSH